MLARGVCHVLRRYSSCGGGSGGKIVAVVGAAGGIGQPLSLLLKINHDLISEVRLQDIAKPTPGIAVDLSHIDTNSTVKGYTGLEKLPEVLKGAHVIVVPAGVPRKPGMSRADLFNVNAQFILDLTVSIVQCNPEALVAIITNPVNTVVPIAAEVMKKKGCFDKNKLFGITTLDMVRSSTFIAHLKGLRPTDVTVQCIGGHSGETIIPILSQSNPRVDLTEEEIKNMTKKIQNAGTEVVNAKAGGGSATLSTAWAACRFVLSLVKGLKGQCDIIECSYVASDVTESPFFSTPLLLGKNGVQENLGIPCNLSCFEEKLLKAAVPELKASSEKGIKFVNEKLKSC